MKTQPFPPGSLVAAYFRDSGGETQDLSISQQEAHFKIWLTENGLAAGAVFRDAARPGSSVAGRQAFHDMMHHFRSSATEAGLVIWSYSRFARDFDDAQFYRADIRRRGYLFYSLNDEIPDGAMGRLFEAAIDWKNEQFLEDLSRDVKRGLADLVRTHGAVPGTPPRGFKRDPIQIGSRRDGRPHIAHRWVPDPDQVPVVQLAFSMRAAGASMAEVHRATALYNSLNSYTTFFANKLYIGVLEFGDQVIENYCDPLISSEIWEAVQLRARQHAAHRNLTDAGAAHPRRVNSRYLLSGLAYCARCGSPLYGLTSQQRLRANYERYACTRAHRRRDCDLQPIPRKVLEDAVLECVQTFVLSPEVQAANLQLIQAQRENHFNQIGEQRADLSKRLATVRRKLSNTANAIAEAGHSPALLETLARLEAEAADLRAKIAGIERQIAAPSSDFDPAELEGLRANLHDPDPAAIQSLLRGLLSRVIVDRDGTIVSGELIYFSPPG
jgi:site-specific DNA recombinase